MNDAPLRVLYIGGTGTISASCVRLSVESGMRVSVLNRGNNAKQRDLPDSVTWLTGDITDRASTESALGDLSFDAVVNFLSYGPADAQEMVDIFGGRTKQYVYISSASIYHKPILQAPITESTLRENPYLEYARDKLAAEDLLMKPAEWYAEHAVETHLGVTATAIDLAERAVTLSDGTELTYDALVLATGSAPVDGSVTG